MFVQAGEKLNPLAAFFYHLLLITINSFLNFFPHLQDDYEGVWNVAAFFVAFVCCVFQVKSYVRCMLPSQSCPRPALSDALPLLCPQCHLYLYHSPLKKHKSLALLSVIVLCNLFLLGLRNVWQLIFHISVASLSTLLILTRKLQDRTSDCGVWGAGGSLPGGTLTAPGENDGEANGLIQMGYEEMYHIL